MEITTLLIGIIFGAILGALILYLMLKSTQVSRKSFEEIQNNFIRQNADLENTTKKNLNLEQLFQAETHKNLEQVEKINLLTNELAKISANNNSYSARITELTEITTNQNSDLKNIQEEKQKLIAINAELSAKKENLQKLLDNQIEEISKMQELAKNEFQNLANKILEEKTEKFTTLNQTNLKTILEPLGENLEIFKKRVNEVYENEARERFSLNNTIKLMMEQTTKISKEANNLATALKGQTKTQGDWGEMILERILEDSGLTKDREYFSQYNIKNEAGENQRPDFVLKLPGNQLVIIDSKVSLNAYERLVSAESDEEKKQNLALHIAAVKKHIDSLALKRYDDLKESLDFTIMFFPVEPAFLLAVQQDQKLWNYAYNKHIILLSPTNLIAYLKLISDVWKRADQSENAEEIARQAAALYDKFEGFVSDLLSVGKKMEGAKLDYENAMKKLSSGNGNLIRSAEKLKQLGVKPKKSLPTSLIERANREKLEFAEDENDDNQSDIL